MLGYFKYEKFNIRNFDFRLISKNVIMKAEDKVELVNW